ncbi:MAG: cytochrome c oxidase subunit II [Phycisphaerae bacterium]|nr:cytochrome c oxidase subunit II [Gemmatimonadaceae bacterium]
MTGPLGLIVAQLRVIGEQSALRTGGPAANEIATLWNFMLLVGGIATVLTFAALGYALFRSRKHDKHLPEADRPADARGELSNEESGARGMHDVGRPASERHGVRAMVAAGIIAPTIILGIVLVATLRALSALTPAPLGIADLPAAGELAVEIGGKQYWWRIRYLDAQPSQVFETANELHIPIGVPVQVRLRSEDVIHSFWVPGLHGKMDLIPGRMNVMTLQADHAGIWRGQCAEFCGMQHTKMAFTVIAESAESFERWRTQQRSGEVVPDSTDTEALAGRANFMQSGCAACHTIRATMAGGRLGPELTHIASRLTLAAGSFPNTAENMYKWISDPQLHKPGSAMPTVPLSAAQLQSVAHYLATLR